MPRGIGTSAWQVEKVAAELARFARGFDGIDPTATPLEVTIWNNYVEVVFEGVRSWTGLDVRVSARVGRDESEGVLYGRADWSEEGLWGETAYGRSLDEKGEVS